MRMCLTDLLCQTHKPLTRTLINQNVVKGRPPLSPLSLAPKNCNHTRRCWYIFIFDCTMSLHQFIFVASSKFHTVRFSVKWFNSYIIRLGACSTYWVLICFSSTECLPHCVLATPLSIHFFPSWNSGNSLADCSTFNKWSISNHWDIHLSRFIIPLNVPFVSGVWKIRRF